MRFLGVFLSSALALSLSGQTVITGGGSLAHGATIAAGAHSAPVQLGSTSSNGCGTTATVTAPCSGTVDITAGTLLTVQVASASNCVLTDVAGNSFAVPDLSVAVAGIEINVYHVHSPMTSTVEAFTCAASGSAPAITAQWFSGIFVGSVDGTPTHAGVGTAVTLPIPTFTPAAANEVCVPTWGTQNVTGFTIMSTPAFSTPQFVPGVGGSHVGISAAYLVTTGTTALAPTGNWSGSSNAVAGIVCYE